MKTAFPLILACLCGCWGSSSYVPVLAEVQVQPSIQVVSAVPTGTTTAYAVGFYFTPETAIQWNGRPLKSTFVGKSIPGVDPLVFNGGALAVQIDLDEELTSASGSALVTASTGGGPLSQPVKVTIFDANFTFAGVSPARLDAGAADTTLTLTGTGFNSVTRVFFDGQVIPSTLVSSTRLTVQVPAAQLVNPGEHVVQLLQQPCDPSTCASTLLRFGFSTLLPVGPSGTRNFVAGRTTSLVWDAADLLLYASITPPGSGSSANVLASVDPATGTIGAHGSVTIGADAILKVSAQDQFVYVLQSTPSIRRYSLPGLTSTAQLQSPSDTTAMAPAPDAPQTLAVTGFPSSIFDGTVQRPHTDSGQIGLRARDLAWGADDTILYVLDSSGGGLSVFHVDSSGIAGSGALSAAAFNGSSDLVFDRVTGRIYGGNGENYDAQGGDPRPLLPTAPANSGCHVAIDSALGKAFFACIEEPYTTVRSFDLATQKFISRVVLATGTSDGFSSTAVAPGRIIRWGTDGLAVASSQGIYFYSGPFVR